MVFFACTAPFQTSSNLSLPVNHAGRRWAPFITWSLTSSITIRFDGMIASI